MRPAPPKRGAGLKIRTSRILVGIEQMAQVGTQPRFKDQLCLLVADSAYSHTKGIVLIEPLKNLVFASRIRNNRKFRLKPLRSPKPKKRGRPKIYGDSWALSDPGECDDFIIIEHETSSGNLCKMRVGSRAID